MAEIEASSSQGWGSSLSLPSSEDVARAVAAAATVVSTPRPSVVFSSNDDGGNSPLKRIQNQVSKVLKGLSPSPDKRSVTYNPEVLTKQKRQWTSYQLESLDERSFMEPSKLFESMVVVGLPPSFDAQSLRKRLLSRKSEGSGKFRIALNGYNHNRVEPNFEPQVLFVYPPEKQLPLKYRDLLSFCFPGGVEVHAVEKSSSMSELNEILLGQEHLKQTELSFVFRLQQGADSSTLYGCCILMEELVDKPSRLISMISESQPVRSCLGRYIFTTKRCYCILSRVPFFNLHFGVLQSIFMEERLERLTKSISVLDLEMPDTFQTVEGLEENGLDLEVADTVQTVEGLEENGLDLEVSDTVQTVDGSEENGGMPTKHVSEDETNETLGSPQSSGTTASTRVTDVGSLEETSSSFRDDSQDTDDSLTTKSYETDNLASDKEPAVTIQNSEVSDANFDNSVTSKPTMEKSTTGAVLPLLRYPQFESSEPSCSGQGSPSEERQLRSENDETDIKETSISSQEDFSSHVDILEWAKANNHGSLQIICEYYNVDFPPRGSSIVFHPLEYLHPLEFHRPTERAMDVSGSPLDLRSCRTSLERVEVLNTFIAEEEATSLSIVTISCICGYLRLENVLTLFAGALLEKQIIFVCSNLGILSASVLSLIPLIRPYQWQSLLMPVLPNDMLDFLDAPVPYIVGVQSKSSEVLSKLPNALLVDISKNQVKSQSMPQLPRQRELLASLAPYHSKLVGESYLGKRRPIYDCTDVQVEAVRGFMEVLRSYLDSLCSNLRSHTITNVQSNDDKVSLLLKESFIDSFASRDRPFMKLFVDTQMFSVHTDFVLSFYQKD
ncbi:hypothetical protein SOVF_173800 [Spinacia oleracea]|nr:hypothetical protein SOVF_173800 [Spinacia oleracea]